MDTNQTTPAGSVPTSQPIQTVTAVFIVVGITLGSILLHLILTFIFKRIAKKTIWQIDDDIVKYCKKPTLIMFPTVAILITIQLITLPSGVYDVVNHVLIIVLLFAISYLIVMVIKCVSLAVGRRNSHLKESNPIRSREIETQIIVMTRIVQGMVWLLGLSGIAMTFPNAWQVGVSLLASASVSAVLLGFAAKPSIENAFASLAIALTQPFLIEDQVVVDGEVGHIEEITSQYVVVRTLDERRMVVPLTWFMANIFQNWSRNSTQQIAECKLYVDYTLSVPRVRQAFLKFAREHPKYDGRHVALLVSGCTSSTIELTCQISVANAMDVIQVTSDVREAMVEFIAKQSVAATATATISALSLGDGGDGSSGSTVKSHTPPLPPLTQEDEKMGNGSKAYQTCSSTNSINVNSTLEKNYPTASEKPTAKTTALRPTPDFVRVILEEPALGGASNGLTRRSARDTETGSMSVDAVVPSIAISEPHLSEKQ